MKRLRRVINNTIISFLGQAVIWTSTLLLTMAFGRFLGATKFGELYFAITFVALLGVLVNSGFDRQTVRDVAQKPDKAAAYLSNMLLIRLGIWFILYILLLLASWLLRYSPEVQVLVAICGLDLLFNAVASTFASLHYAFERTIFPVVGNVLEKGLSALFGILLLKAGAGVETMAVVIVVGSFINGVWQAAWFFRMLTVKFTIDLALIREILRKNVPFFFNGALWTSYTSIDTVLLSVMTTSTVVGWYGAANRLFDTMSFLPIIVITTIMYPIFSKLSLVSDADLKLAFEKSVNFLLFCGIPIATAMIVAAPKIIGFLYQKHEFTHSIPALQAVAPGVVFAFINYALNCVILSKKQDGKLPIVSGIALVFNVVLNLVLIVLYQHIGAAIASSLTEVLVCCIFLAFIPRNLLPFGSLRVALKALIASLVMALVILALHSVHIILVLPIATLVYVGASVLFGVIPREDYQAIYRAIRLKAQPSSRLSTSDLPETPQPSYNPDAMLEVELATTMKLPAMRLQSSTNGLPETPQPSYNPDAMLEMELATTMRLPAVRLQSRQSGTNGLAKNPQPPDCADAMLEDGLNASNQKLRDKSNFYRPVSGYKYFPIWRFRKFNLQAFSVTKKLPGIQPQQTRQYPPAQQKQIGPMSKENSSNNGGLVV